MIKLPISTIPETLNKMVLKISELKKVSPSDISVEVTSNTGTTFNVNIGDEFIGTIIKCFETLMFLPK